MDPSSNRGATASSLFASCGFWSCVLFLWLFLNTVVLASAACFRSGEGAMVRPRCVCVCVAWKNKRNVQKLARSMSCMCKDMTFIVEWTSSTAAELAVGPPSLSKCLPFAGTCSMRMGGICAPLKVPYEPGCICARDACRYRRVRPVTVGRAHMGVGEALGIQSQEAALSKGLLDGVH